MANKKRNYNWQHLKGILWKERKEGGQYKFNSPNFNKLVSEVYDAMGKKNPKRNLKEAQIQAERLEGFIFEEIPENFEEIAYYDLDRQLQELQSQPAFTDFFVQTHFNAKDFPDELFSLAHYEYEGSMIEGLIKAVDVERKSIVMEQTPPPKFVFKVNKKKKTINIYVNKAPSEPVELDKKGKPKKRVQPITKIRTKESLTEKSSQLKSNLEDIKQIEKDVRVENKALLALVKAKASSDTIGLYGDSIASKMKQVKALTKQNVEIKKYLNKSEGYSQPKKTKAKAKKRKK